MATFYMDSNELDLRTALAEVYPPDKFHKPIRKDQFQTQSQLASRRAAAPLLALKTSFDDIQLAIQSPTSPQEVSPQNPSIRRSRPSLPPATSQTEPLSDAPALKAQQSSKSSLANLFSKPNVERARGYNEAGLKPPPTASQTSEQSRKRGSPSERSFQSKDGASRASSAGTPSRLQSRPSTRLRSQASSPAAHVPDKRAPDHIQHKLGTAWEPPTLPAAYPQAVRHTVLDNADWCLGILPKSKTRKSKTAEAFDKSKMKSSVSLKPPEAVWKPSGGDAPNLAHEDAEDNMHSLFILVTSGYLLEYTAEGPPERKPERTLKLSPKSVAFVSDKIPGRYYVLHVLEDAASEPIHGSGQAPRKSIFSKLFSSAHLSRRRTCPSMLLVFDAANEMNDWMRAIRREIDMLNGRPARPHTATRRYSSEVKEEETSAPLHRALTITKGRASDKSSLGLSPPVSPELKQPENPAGDISRETASQPTRRSLRAASFTESSLQSKPESMPEEPSNADPSPPSSASTPISPVSHSSSSEQRQDTTAASSFDVSDVSHLSDEDATLRSGAPLIEKSPDLTFYTPSSTPQSTTFTQPALQPRKSSLVSSASDDRLARRSQRYNLYPPTVLQRRSFTPSGPPNTPLPLNSPVLLREPLSPNNPASIAEESDTEASEDVPATPRSFGHSPRSPYFSHRTPEPILEDKKFTTPTHHIVGNAFAQRTSPYLANSATKTPTEEPPCRPLPFRSSTFQQRQSHHLQSTSNQQWPLRRASLTTAALPLRVSTAAKSSPIHPLRSSPTNVSSYVPHSHLESLTTVDPASYGLAISTDHRTSLVDSDSRTTALHALIGEQPSFAHSAKGQHAPTSLANPASRSSQALKRPPSIQVNTNSPFFTPSKSSRTSVGPSRSIGATGSDMPHMMSSTRVPIVRPRSIRPGGITAGATSGVRPRRSTPSLAPVAPPSAPPPDVPLPPPPGVPAQVSA